MADFYVSEDYIIRPTQEVGLTLYGYDILTETYVSVRRDMCYPITQSVLKLMANVRAKVCLADWFGEDRFKKAALFGIGERSWHRYLKDYS